MASFQVDNRPGLLLGGSLPNMQRKVTYFISIFHHQLKKLRKTGRFFPVLPGSFLLCGSAFFLTCF
jgi:hypothetical protein